MASTSNSPSTITSTPSISSYSRAPWPLATPSPFRPPSIAPSTKCAQALSAISQAGLPPTFGDDDGGHVIGAPRSPLPPTAGSVALTSAGIYAMTGARSQLFIDAGQHGAFSGGHGHADALSIQLVTDGRRVLIDPGTFCYVCPERDRFRGTAAHNTLQVDGRDQATPVNPFAWTGMPQTTVDRWLSGDTYDLFAGHHDGYHPVIHHRWVFGLKNRFWLVRDVVTDPRLTASRLPSRDRQGVGHRQGAVPIALPSTGTSSMSAISPSCRPPATPGRSPSSPATGRPSTAKRSLPSSCASAPRLPCPPNSP